MAATSPSRVTGASTITEAKDWLRERLDEGARCPCCTQHAQVYRWSLYGTAARLLIAMWRKGGKERFVESKTVKRPGDGGSASHLSRWGLVEHEPDRRPDGGKSGWWRVTATGEEFVLRRATIPKYVYVFDGRVLRTSGGRVSIDDCLGKKFNYRELMEA